LETVTLVLDGVLEHGDNTGNSGALHPGDVQWMTAGRGIIHRELAFRNEFAHILQMWLNLPAKAKMVDTRYQDLLARSRPSVTAPGVRIEAVSGTVGAAGLSTVEGPALNHLPVTGSFVTLDPGCTVDYELPASHRAFAYVMSGAATVAGRNADAGQIAWSDPVPAGHVGPASGRSTLRLATREREHETKLMVYSGQPLNEPIVFGGPFVMNEQREIHQAFQDFHAGKFGDVPRQARLKYS
jgi:quercetin 2,3-dioxygenase